MGSEDAMTRKAKIQMMADREAERARKSRLEGLLVQKMIVRTNQAWREGGGKGELSVAGGKNVLIATCLSVACCCVCVSWSPT